VADAICPCGNPIPQSAPSGGPRRKYCTTCRPPRRSQSKHKICTEDGCNSPVLARGFCPTHYSTWHRSQKKYTITCAVCGKTAQVQRRKTKHCSYQCGMEAVNAERWKAEREANGGAKIGPKPRLTEAERRRRLAEQKLKRASRGTKGRTIWVQRTCKMCPTVFLTPSSGPGRCCSKFCTERNKEDIRHARVARRRSRQKDAFVENVSRMKILKRDNYRCHICGRKTDPRKKAPHPRSPTIDHIIPLARGGKHESANVATACFICNAIKRDQGGGEQLALIG